MHTNPAFREYRAHARAGLVHAPYSMIAIRTRVVSRPDTPHGLSTPSEAVPHVFGSTQPCPLRPAALSLFRFRPSCAAPSRTLPRRPEYFDALGSRFRCTTACRTFIARLHPSRSHAASRLRRVLTSPRCGIHASFANGRHLRQQGEPFHRNRKPSLPPISRAATQGEAVEHEIDFIRQERSHSRTRAFVGHVNDVTSGVKLEGAPREWIPVRFRRACLACPAVLAISTSPSPESP